MPRKGQRLKARKPAAVKPAGPGKRAADPLAHLVLARYMEAHFEAMLVTGYSADTVRARRIALRRFIAWCEERVIRQPADVTRAVLERYQRHLFYYRKPDGAPLTLGSQYGALAPLKTWFKSFPYTQVCSDPILTRKSVYIQRLAAALVNGRHFAFTLAFWVTR